MMIGSHPRIAVPSQELWLFGHENSIAQKTSDAISEWLELPTVSNIYSSSEARENVRNSIVRASIRGAITPALGDLEHIRIIGDKTPNFYAVSSGSLHTVFPDGYFVHIVRDPRDVIVSHHFHAFRLSEWSFFGDKKKAKKVAERISAGDFVGHDLLDETAVKRLCRHWVDVQQGSNNASKLFGDRYYCCRYEDLLLNGENIMAQIFSMLGEPLQAEKIAEIVQQHSFEALSGGRKAGTADASNFFRKGVSGDWKMHFDDHFLGIASNVCADAAASFGFDVRSSE